MVQLELAGAVHWALSPEAGGRMDASLNDVCCHVGRIKVGNVSIGYWVWPLGHASP